MSDENSDGDTDADVTYDDGESYDAADHDLADATVDDEAILYAAQLQELKDAGF